MSKKKEEQLSHLLILLVHIIKVHAERRITSSWQNSINNALKYIRAANYEIKDLNLEVEDIWEEAISYASFEVREGISSEALLNLVDKELIILHINSLLNIK